MIKSFVSICLCLFYGLFIPCIIGAEEPIKRGAELSLEEELRRQLGKIDRWSTMQLLRTERDVDKKQKKWARSSSQPEELAILAEDEDLGVRFYVASNRHITLDMQLLLAQDRESLVRAGIALSLKFDPREGEYEKTLKERIALRLSSDQNPLVRLVLAQNQFLPDSTYRALAGDLDPFIRKELARNIKLPKSALMHLIQDNDEEVVIAALAHHNLAGEWLEEKSKASSSGVRQAVGQNINTPITTLEILARDPVSVVREAVAQHPRATLEILEPLAKDAEVGVQLLVVKHPNADRALLLQMAEMSDEIVLKTARKRLAPLLKGEIREDVLERWKPK